MQFFRRSWASSDQDLALLYHWYAIDLGKFLIALPSSVDVVKIGGVLADLSIANSLDGGIEEEEDEEMPMRGGDRQDCIKECQVREI